MRSRSIPTQPFHAAYRQTVRGLLLSLALATLLIGTTATTMAQEAPSADLTVVGVGEATAPAGTARLQLLITRGDRFGAIMVGPEPMATPTTAAQEDAEDLLAPIIDAIVEQGVDESNVAVAVSPIGSDFAGQSGRAVGRIDVTLDQPTRESLNDFLEAVSSAAADQDLTLGQVGAAFEVEDCLAFERDARAAAIEDARERADMQAELLGVQIGPVTASSDLPYGGLLGGVGVCALPGGGTYSSSTGSGLPVTLPQYDPGAEAVVEVHVVLSLTFAIAQG